MATSSESRFGAVVRFALRSSKRLAVTVVGATLVLVGLAMFVLPGPGIVVVAAGFAVLGTQYAWAAAALDRAKATAERAGQLAKGAAVSTSRAARDAAGGAAGRLRRRKQRGSVGDI